MEISELGRKTPLYEFGVQYAPVVVEKDEEIVPEGQGVHVAEVIIEGALNAKTP